MSLPAAVETILEQHNVLFEITDTPDFSDSKGIPIDHYMNWEGALRCVLLSNKEGKLLQVIVPAKSLLDLNAIESLTSCRWQAASDAEIASITSRSSLFSLPALPQLAEVQTLLDESILELDQVIIESGGETGLLKIPQQSFQQLLACTLTGQIHIPIDQKKNCYTHNDDINAITTAVEQFTNKRVKQRLEDTLEFPPLPDTAQRIIKLRVNPDADIKDLTDIVELDPSLAAQVVSWANSPYYAVLGDIKSVQDAVVRVLGFDLVMNLALGLALGKTLKIPKDQPRGLTDYWQQSIYTAACIEELVKKITPKQRPEQGIACLAGLLHNFGYLILADVFPPYFSSICRYIEANPHLGHSDIEHHLIGIDREQLGSWLMRIWNMPEEVSTALRHQHNQHYNGEYCKYANILFVAKHLLSKHGIGDAPLLDIPISMYQHLGLDQKDAEDAVANVVDCVQDIENMASNMAKGAS